MKISVILKLIETKCVFCILQFYGRWGEQLHQQAEVTVWGWKALSKRIYLR